MIAEVVLKQKYTLPLVFIISSLPYLEIEYFLLLILSQIFKLLQIHLKIKITKYSGPVHHVSQTNKFPFLPIHQTPIPETHVLPFFDKNYV